MLPGKAAVADVPDQTKRVQEDGRGPDVHTVSERDLTLRVGHQRRRQPILSGDLFGQFGGFSIVNREHDRPLPAGLASRFLEVAHRLQTWLR